MEYDGIGWTNLNLAGVTPPGGAGGPQSALGLAVYIQLPPGINFGISLKRSEITQMGYFWSVLDS